MATTSSWIVGMVNERWSALKERRENKEGYLVEVATTVKAT